MLVWLPDEKEGAALFVLAVSFSETVLYEAA
jgi:hypothetical protein